MLRRSLLVRLLAGSIVVAVCAIAATAWLAARGTTVAIQEENGRAIADDTRIYDTLVGYAATHPTWVDVGPVVDRLRKATGRTITLTTESRTYLAGSRGTLPATASAVVDPLAVDPALDSNAPADRIDPRAVGPYRLRPADRAALRGMADGLLKCVLGRTGVGAIVTDPTGRPSISGSNQSAISTCEEEAVEDPPRRGPFGADDAVKARLTTLDSVTPSEAAAYLALQGRTNRCLGRRGLPGVRVEPDFTWLSASQVAGRSAGDVESCLVSAHRAQLDPFVAPPALVFTSTQSAATTSFDWSSASAVRIAGVVVAVLLVTVMVSVLGGFRLIRPLRDLTTAARSMAAGDDSIRVPTGRHDEIGALAVAFNDLADSRAHTEVLRRAMVSDIAHELRTPLSNIRGWLEAVEDGFTEPDQRFMTSLSEEAALLQHIIDDLRDLATADAGNLRLHPEHLHVATLYDQVLAPYRVRAADRGISLLTDVADDIEIEADPLRLRQVLGNLVDNALRHTQRDGHVVLSARSGEREIEFEVRDDGTGIAAANLPHVFERFWRADASRTRPSGGSGLGLAIVRSLVEAHDGAVSVTSGPGPGTTFVVRLPRVTPQPQDVSPSRAAAGPSGRQSRP